ncbi:MAG TPA: response regulator transcription factor, partial [Saprospiraceae bacterium]|nr:response regulator transcription factor [Saprospiraceae bacterium]
MKVLLIEDEPKMVRSLKKGLEEHLIEVDSASDGAAGSRLADANDYSVIISDVMMPEMNGLDLLRHLRKRGNHTPVILLTALGQTDDKVTGFEAGADDYLTKPFEFRELLMRVRALARRPVETYQSTPVLRFADVEMNLDTKEFFRKGQRIQLTPREFALMEYFLRNPGRAISKTEISERVWNLNFDTGTNVIEVYVNFLRKKVDKGFPQKLIHTQFKTGYVLREETVEG